METQEASGRRFFVTAGYFSNRQIVEIVRAHFPSLHDMLPPITAKGGDFPETGIFGYDNSGAMQILNLQFRSLETCIVDSVKSMQKMHII